MALTTNGSAVGGCQLPNRVMASTAGILSFPLFNFLSVALVTVKDLHPLHDISGAFL